MATLKIAIGSAFMLAGFLGAAWWVLVFGRPLREALWGLVPAGIGVVILVVL